MLEPQTLKKKNEITYCTNLTPLNSRKTRTLKYTKDTNTTHANLHTQNSTKLKNTTWINIFYTKKERRKNPENFRNPEPKSNRKQHRKAIEW